jgi:CelD/BcsL family acetyltransferase involved in cellulose biosynthesis
MDTTMTTTMTMTPGRDLLLADQGSLNRIEDVWRELWRRTEPVPPMLEFQWIRQWWRLHRDEGRLFVVLSFDERRRPIGLAPLYLRDEGVVRHPTRWLRTIQFLGTGEAQRDEVTGEYTSWLGAPSAGPTVTRQVLAELQAAEGSWDRIQLDCLTPAAGIHQPLIDGLAGCLAHSEVSARPSFRSPVRPLAEYLKALPSANFRHRCRRALRAGEEQGLQLVRAHTPAEAQEMFAALMALHQRRWQRRGEPGVFASGVFTSFQTALLNPYLSQQAAWLVGLRSADGARWLAVRYLLRAGDTLYDYLSGVDTEVSPALAPGLLLHLHTIDAAARAGIARYDLMAGDADYKRHLGIEQSDLVSADLFARTMRSRLWLAARDLRRRVKEAARNARHAPERDRCAEAPGSAALPAGG